MALSNVWSNARRVITQGLVVTYKKELRHAVNINYISRPYWHYERRRTMECEYLGLTRGAAEACCAAWNKALYRKAWRQEWIGNDPDNSNNGIVGYWSSYFSGDIYDETKYDFIIGGAASLQYNGGKGWTVTVSIDETLPYNHKPFNPDMSDRSTFWAFENNPEIITPAFRYGDPDGITGADVLTDFSLDALEYQFALTSAEWAAFGATSGIKVCWLDNSDISPQDFVLEYKSGDYDLWHSISTPLSGGDDFLIFPLKEIESPLSVRLSRRLSYNSPINQYTQSNVLEVK